MKFPIYSSFATLIQGINGVIKSVPQLLYSISWLMLTLFTSSTVHAIFLGPPVYVGEIPNALHKHGYVMARSIVRDEAGEPILVTYNNDGSEAGVVPVSGYDVSELVVTSAAGYRAEEQRLKAYELQFKDTLAKGATLMSRDEFLSTSFLAADGETVITTPTLAIQFNSVLVRGQADRLSLDPNILVLMTFSFDLTTSEVNDNSVALVVAPNGVVLAQSSLNIGYRSGFFGDPNTKQNQNKVGRVKTTDSVFGPVAYTLVEVGAGVYGYGSTDENGFYNMVSILPPCPVGGWEYKTEVYAELNYINLLPMGSPVISYYLRTPGYDSCYADLVPAVLAPTVMGIIAARSIPYYQSNLYADVMFLTGQMYMLNHKGGIVPMGETTHTSFEEQASDKLQHFYDFNGDGQFDKVVAGNLVTQTNESGEDQDVFEASNDGTGNLQGLYFDTPEAGQAPDLLRVMDQQIRTESVGLLESISQADLRNTDVLFFRESTGQLIMERKGLKEAEVRVGDVMLDEEDQLISYRVMLRGPRDWNLNIGGAIDRNGSYKDWATKYQLTEPFQEKESDHIRPGETIKIVAINRATGYMGTVRTPLTKTSQGNLTVAAPPIALRPPNLKVWAERKYDVEQGLTKGDEKTYTIGAEGAALTSDTTITIYTEWLDEYGKPLPEELGLDSGEQYGFTGRLAKVVGPNQLQGVGAGNDLASFAIAPGRRTQVINVGSNLTTAEHYYVHVIGKAKDQECVGSGSCPSFTELGSKAPYNSRPNLLVPFMVPLPDEDASWLEYNAYRGLLKDTNIIDKPNKPLPAYSWAYRPEYQFSQYGLEMQEIKATQHSASGDEQTSNLLTSSSPTIASSDDYITALYSLISSNNERLTAIDGPQELVLALGQEEQLITIGEDNSITFSNVEHLASLDPEDFLSMRLYTNNDASNILWEYAFEYLALDTQYAGYDDVSINETTGETQYYVSADDPTFPMQSFVVGYANRDPAKKSPVNVQWGVQGSGYLAEQSAPFNPNGVFTANLTMPPTAGAKATVTATLADGDTKATFGEIVVVPGKPASIAVSHDGDAFIEGHKGKQINLLIRDGHGNKVADGTSVTFTVDGYAQIINATDGTVNGEASAFIVGANIPDSNVILTVSAGNVEESLTIAVQPLVVNITDYATNMETKKSYPIKVSVIEPDGTPAANVAVIFTTNAGKFKNSRIETNANGEAIAQLYSGFDSVTNLKIGARVGLIPGTVASGTITPNEATYAQTSQTLVVGDETTNGIYEYERFDGATLGLDYKTQAQILLHGSPEDSQTLTLGSLAEPNLQPIAAYIMNQLDDEQATDENQLHHGITQHVTLVEDNPTQTGKSFEFKKLAELSPSDEWESSKITVAQDERLKPQNSVGFRLDVKPQTTGGELFNFEGGVQSLNLEDDGRLTYQVFTENGMASVSSSAAVSLNAWHTVAGKYKDGTLILEVNGVVSETQVAGKLEYSVTNRGLTIGENFTGRLSSVKLYNYDNAPLVTFSDGSTQTTQTFAADTYEDAVQVISNGQLNTQTEQATTYRIGLTANINTGDDAGKTQDYFIGVVSKAYYGQLASLYIDAAKPEGYPIVSMNAYQRSPLVPFMGVAHAGFVDWIADNAFDTLVSAIGFLIPYEEGIGLVKQVYYLATGDDDFDSLELTLNALGVASFIPILKPLLPLTKALKGFLRPLKASNPKFIKAIGGVMGKVTDDLLSGKLTTIIQMAPFLIIAGEMLSDEEARQGLMVMVNSITSTDDMFAWIDYLRLPADGWEGDGEPPEVELSASVSVNEVEDGFSPLSAIFPVAYAKKPKFTPRRLKGLVFGKTVARLAQKNKLIKDDPTILTKTISSITKGMKDAPVSYRKIVFSSLLVRAGTRLIKWSKNTLNRLLKGDENQRTSSSLLLASIVYLELQIEEGHLFNGDISSQIELRELYARLILPGKSQYGDPKKHGAGFHLVMIAYKHLMHKVNGEPKVKAIEGVRRIIFTKSGLKYDREVDMVLEDAGGEKWLELKSYAKPFNKYKFEQWSFMDKTTKGKKSSHIHKEFYSDFSHLNNDAEEEGGADYSKLLWRFQSFKTAKRKNGTKGPEGPDSKYLTTFKLKTKLCRKAKKVNDEDVKWKTGENSKDLRTLCRSEFDNIVDVQNAATFVADFAGNGLFDDIKDLVEENALEH